MKNTRVMATLAKVLFIVMIVCCCIPVGILTYIGNNMDVDVTRVPGLSLFTRDGRMMTSTGEVISQMSTILTGAIILCYVYFNVYRMFKAIDENRTPFCQDCIRRLKKISITLIVYSLVMPIVETGFSKTFAPELSLKLTPDSVSILMALIVLFISYAFKYGAQLQKQSDETL